jgi:hypothetical protein
MNQNTIKTNRKIWESFPKSKLYIMNINRHFEKLIQLIHSVALNFSPKNNQKQSQKQEESSYAIEGEQKIFLDFGSHGYEGTRP